MAEPVMENPLSPTPSLGAHYAKLLQDIKECISELKQEFEDTGGLPITDDCQALQRLCAKLEYLLQSGMKAKSSLLGGKKDYWNYISDCLGSNKSLNDGIRFVKSISELRTNLGRGRALLRFCLMHQRTADTLQQCTSNLRTTGDWYTTKSFWFNRKLVSELLNDLYDLNDLQFDLSPRGYDLDASWPTFARRTFGTPYSWRPPSRTVSITSLSSIPAMENLPSLSTSVEASTPPTPDPEVARLQAQVTDTQRLLSESQAQVCDAQRKLTASQAEAWAAQSKMVGVESKIAAAEVKGQGQLAEQVDKLKAQLDAARAKSTDYEVQNEKLSQELKLKESVWTEKEEMLKVRAEEAEKMLTEFKSDLDTTSGAMAAFDVMELRGQLVVANKKNKSLEIQQKGVQMELESKERVNQKKTELIDLLDKKLAQQKGKIDYLIKTAEKVVAEKETQSRKLASASEELIKLSNKYVESEKSTNDLRRINKELKAMLNSLEGKGKQLAGMAREKVKSYSNQNKILQEEVDGLRQEINTNVTTAAATNQNGASYKDLESMLTNTCSDILQQVSKLVSRENLDSTGQAELTKIQTQLKELESGRRTLDAEKLSNESEKRELENLKRTVADVNKQKQELEAQIKSLQGQGQAKLESELEAKNAELVRLRTELGAIRSLVMQQVAPAATTQELSESDAPNEASEEISTTTIISDLIKRLEKTSNQELRDEEPDGAEESNQVSQLLLENAQLKTMVSQESVQAADQQSESEVELAKLQEDLANVKQQFQEAANEKDQQMLMVESLRDMINEKDSNINELTEKIEIFTEEVNGYKKSHESTVSEKNELHEQVKSTEAKMAEMEENFLLLVSSIAELKDENEALMTSREDFEAEVEGLESDKQELQLKISSMETNLDSTVQERLSKLRGQLDEVESDKKKLAQELEKAEGEVSSKGKELEDLSKERKQLEDEFSEKSESWKKDANLLEEAKKVLEGDMLNLKTESQSKIDNLEKYLEELKNKESSLQQILDEQQRRESEMDSKIAELAEKLKVEHQAKDDLESKAKDFNFQFMSTKDAVETKSSEVEHLTDTVKEKDIEIQRLNAVIEEKEKDKNTIKQELEGARNMVRELQIDFPSNTSQDPDELSKVETESVQKQGVIVPNVQVENVNLRMQIEMLVANKDQVFQKLVEEKSSLMEQLKSLIEDVEEKSRAFDNMQIQYQNLEAEAEALKEDSDGKKEAIETLMANMEKAKEEMEDLRTKVTVLPECEEDIKALKAEVSTLKDAAAESRKEWDREKDGLEKEASALRFEMSAKEMEYEEKIKKVEGDVSERLGLESQIQHQEALSDTLEAEIRELREEKEAEEDRTSQLHKELTTVIKQNKTLSRELVTTNEVLHKERREVTKLRLQINMSLALSPWTTLAERDQSLSVCESSHQEATSALEGDNTELKKRIITLVREKDALWQKIVTLEHQQQLRKSDVWLDSSKVSQCMACNAAFHILLRKHHCRLCGRIFCHDCCNNWVMTPHSSRQERVCGSCVMSHSQLEPSTEPDSASIGDDFQDSVALPTKLSTKWGQASDVEVSESEDDLGLRSAGAIATGATIATSDLTSSTIATSDLTSSTIATTSPEPDPQITEVPDPPGAVSVDSSLDAPDEKKLLGLTDDDKSSAIRVNTSTPEPADSEEAYELITDDEVIESMCEPLPDPNVSSHVTLTTEDIESRASLSVCPPDLWVSAGRSYVVPVYLEEAGTTLNWEFTTTPKCISFSLTYRENSLVSADRAESLVPLCRCNSHRETISGALTARRAGVYTLVFDNTTSRFTSKKLDFTLSVARPGAYVT